MSKELEDRNIQMAKDYWQNGVRAKFLARKHNISVQRVHAIVNKHKATYETKK